ncbi:unnamed protein product [Protopolystoma xenopodis]|uniref:Uncharacterized protein n=1 Tax=Protopolystoma xenopodis TaxID=117903 RepID=A0A448X3R7_9PLAT|nr:unnamed protein product [Protopolystoma xenopodis]
MKLVHGPVSIINTASWWWIRALCEHAPRLLAAAPYANPTNLIQSLLCEAVRHRHHQQVCQSSTPLMGANELEADSLRLNHRSRLLSCDFMGSSLDSAVLSVDDEHPTGYTGQEVRLTCFPIVISVIMVGRI